MLKKTLNKAYLLNLIIFAIMKNTILILTILFLCNYSFSQENKTEGVVYEKAIIITPIVQVNIPGASLAEKSGVLYGFGMGVDYKFGKNFYLGAEGEFLFSPKSKETEHINNTLTGSGLVITNEDGIGILDDVNLSTRGAIVKATVGKSFYFRKEKPSSGILVKFGVGYLQHKILIDVNKRITPQLSGDYAKGYDRLNRGILLSQYIGLIKLEKGKFVNLALGFEISEAFSQNVRPHDFYLNQKISGTKIDLMFGVKFTWMIPVYLGESSTNDYYYY